MVPRDAARIAEQIVALDNRVSINCTNCCDETYTKPRLMSPQTAAFVDKGILTFQTTWMGRIVQNTSVATAYAARREYKTRIVCSETNMLEGRCYRSALLLASSDPPMCHSSMLRVVSIQRAAPPSTRSWSRSIP